MLYVKKKHLLSLKIKKKLFSTEITIKMNLFINVFQTKYRNHDYASDIEIKTDNNIVCCANVYTKKTVSRDFTKLSTPSSRIIFSRKIHQSGI